MEATAIVRSLSWTHDGRGRKRGHRVIRARIGRWGTTVVITALLTSQVFVGVAQAAKSTSKVVLIGSSVGSGVNDPGPTASGQANLTFAPGPLANVTAGNDSFFDVVVKNAGSQTLNNIQLSIGYDDRPLAENGRPITTALTPTFPVAFPAGNVTIVSAIPTGCSLPTDINGNPIAAGPISCVIGTLLKGSSFHIDVLLATTAAATVPVKAVTKVAENTNDNGANQDTFAAEGTLTIDPFSCETNSAYLPGNTADKIISTCAVGDAANGNKQSFGVKFPARLTTVTLNEDGTANLCPVTDCFGATFIADITGDATTDIVTWTVVIDLVSVGKTNLNLNKLVVYHYNDEGVLSPSTGIPNTKSTQCKSTTQKDCIVSATITDNVLTVIFQTAGNGTTRVH